MDTDQQAAHYARIYDQYNRNCLALQNRIEALQRYNDRLSEVLQELMKKNRALVERLHRLC